MPACGLAPARLALAYPASCRYRWSARTISMVQHTILRRASVEVSPSTPPRPFKFAHLPIFQMARPAPKVGSCCYFLIRQHACCNMQSPAGDSDLGHIDLVTSTSSHLPCHSTLATQSLSPSPPSDWPDRVEDHFRLRATSYDVGSWVLDLAFCQNTCSADASVTVGVACDICRCCSPTFASDATPVKKILGF